MLVNTLLLANSSVSAEASIAVNNFFCIHARTYPLHTYPCRPSISDGVIQMHTSQGVALFGLPRLFEYASHLKVSKYIYM